MRVAAGPIAVGIIAMAYSNYPRASLVGNEIRFDTVAGMLAETKLEDGARTSTSARLTAGDGGGNTYIYHATGRPAVAAGDGRPGFVIDGSGADDWFEAVDQTVADIKQFGAKTDGTDSSAAINAACAFDNVRVPPGIYHTSAIITGNFKDLDGYGATLLPLNELDQVVTVPDGGVVRGLTVDCDGDTVTLTSARGEGIRLGTGSKAIDCTVLDTPIGASANGFYIASAGAPSVMQRCTVKDPGYACVRFNGSGVVVDCDFQFTRVRADSQYRWAVANGNPRLINIRGGRWWSDQAVETTAVFDTVGQPQADRQLVISELDIDHTNYSGGLNNHVIKADALTTVTLDKVTSNVPAPVFLRGGGTDHTIIRDCDVLGTLNFSGDYLRRLSIRDSTLRATDVVGTDALSETENILSIVIDGCFIDGYVRFTNSIRAVDQRMSIRDTQFHCRNTSNATIFSSIQDFESLELRNFRLFEDGTANAFLSNKNERRLMAYRRGKDCVYDGYLTEWYGLPDELEISGSPTASVANLAALPSDPSAVSVRAIYKVESNGLLYFVRAGAWQPWGYQRVIATIALRDALTEKVIGQRVYVTADSTNYEWDGAAWNSTNRGNRRQHAGTRTTQATNSEMVWRAIASSSDAFPDITAIVSPRPATKIIHGNPATDEPASWTFDGSGWIPSSPVRAYAAISVTGNSTATTISAASTPVQVTVFDTDNTVSLNATPDHTNDHVTTDVAGNYRASVSISVSGISGDTVAFRLYKNNGATLIGPDVTVTLSGGVDRVSFDSIPYDLAVGDTSELWVSNETDTDDVTIEDVTLYIERVD